MPVLVPVSVIVTSSESPLLLVTIAVSVSAMAGFAFWSRSVTRIQAALLAAKEFVAVPLLPLVNSVMLGVPRSRKMSDRLVAATEVMPSVPSLAVAAIV